MRRSTGLVPLILAIFSLLLLTTPASGATPTSWCKCTCFKKSWIIPLDARASSASKRASERASQLASQLLTQRIPQESNDNGDNSDNTDDTAPTTPIPVTPDPFKPKTGSDCNRSFCLEQNLPDCKDATEEDVQTSCFQRDSSKDQVVVFVFIIATVSLLAWALARPFVGRWMEQAKERRSYIPVSNGQDR